MMKSENGKVKSHIKKNKKSKDKDRNAFHMGTDMANYGNKSLSEFDKLVREVLETILERDYKSEYEKYHSRPEQKKRRAQRNKSRRKMEKSGKVTKGDGKDVHHKNHNTADTSADNLAVMDKSKNRAMNR
jgi:hypothetical protein